MKYEQSSFAWEDLPADLGTPDLGDRETVSMSVTDGVATVLLNRPERRNALDGRMLRDLADVLRSCDRSDAVGAVVLSGTGPVFCVGSELGGGENPSFGGEPTVDLASLPWISPYQLRKPVLAALHGHAVGAGLTLALQCDVRFVAREAKLGFPFVRRGVVAEWMGHWTAVRLAGIGRAAELLLTGSIFSGSDAERWGLANVALDAAEVLPAAQAMAAEMVELAAPLSLAASKRLLWESLEGTREESGRREREVLDELVGRPDATEGVRSFLEKRPPVWTGRPSVDLPGWPS